MVVGALLELFYFLPTVHTNREVSTSFVPLALLGACHSGSLILAQPPRPCVSRRVSWRQCEYRVVSQSKFGRSQEQQTKVQADAVLTLEDVN